jgi:cyclic pyranopterin phosphate synthase
MSTYLLKEKRNMTVEEIERLVGVGSKLGIRKVKLTGGELLLRSDIVEIVGKISKLVDEVSLTTNAIKLATLAEPLRAAGLARVNISLHTIQPKTYKKICGTDRLGEALAGLDAAIKAGLQPIKINMVLLKGVNEHEVLDMLEFASEKGVILQIIEFVTDKERIDNQGYIDYHKDLDEWQQWLIKNGRLIGLNQLHSREKYLVESIPGDHPKKLTKPVQVELVMPMHNTEFCANCTRIRLTAGGYVKGCLFDKDNVLDILGPLRQGLTDKELEKMFLDVIMNRMPYWTEADQCAIVEPKLRGEVN